jgi:hypothetical protein
MEADDRHQTGHFNCRALFPWGRCGLPSAPNCWRAQLSQNHDTHAACISICRDPPKVGRMQTYQTALSFLARVTLSKMSSSIYRPASASPSRPFRS